jgi:hypothetical protein
VLNAGISKAARIADYTVEDFDNLFSTNVRGPFFLVQQLLPVLGEGVNIVVISSLGARMVIGKGQVGRLLSDSSGKASGQERTRGKESESCGAAGQARCKPGKAVAGLRRLRSKLPLPAFAAPAHVRLPKESLEHLWDYRYEGAILNYLHKWMDQLRWQRLLSAPKRPVTMTTGADIGQTMTGHGACRGSATGCSSRSTSPRQRELPNALAPGFLPNCKYLRPVLAKKRP